MNYRTTFTSALALAFGLFASNEALATGQYYTGDVTLTGNITEKVKHDNNGENPKIKIINATFDGLYDDSSTATGATPDYGSERGGAVSSLAEITEVTSSTFTNNEARPSSGYAYGGAIHLQVSPMGIIDDSTFIGNKATSEAGSRAWGGAIHSNRATIEGITNSKFIGNIAQTNSTSASGENWAEGGAVHFNGGWLKKIDNVLFDGNKSIATGSYATAGGLSMFSAGLGSITNSTFSNNTATSGGANNFTLGGAMYLGRDTWGGDVVEADFLNNGAISEYAGYGGAFYIGTSDYRVNLKGKYEGNYTKAIGTAKTYSNGGAIYADSNSNLADITVNFINNNSYAEGATTSSANGGAIYNRGTIGNIVNSLFQGNYTEAKGTSGTSTSSYAGAIYNRGTIGDITGASFIENKTIAKVTDSVLYTEGGAIRNQQATIGKISGLFKNNSVNATSTTGDIGAEGGAISTYDSTFGEITSDFIGNSITATSDSGNLNIYGGAITNWDSAMTFRNSNFKDNSITATSTGDIDAKGGAIFLTKDTNAASAVIIADGGNSVFSGNKVMVNGATTNNAIWANDADVKVELQAVNNGKILFDDEIDGVEGYKLDLSGDESGLYQFGAAVKNANITAKGKSSVLGIMNLSNNNNALDVIDGGIFKVAGLSATDNLHFRKFSLTGGSVEFSGVSVDLENATMGRITAGDYASGSGKINVNSMILTSDANGDNASVLFADSAIAGNVVNNITGDLQAPIHKYSVAYDDSTGKFEFVKTGVASDVTNTGSSAAATGSNQTTIDNEVLDRAEELVSKSMVHQGSELVIAGTTSGEAPILNLWVKPFGADEDVELKYGRVVDSKLFGLMAGVDTLPIAYGNGYSAIYTLYGVYSNALLKNDGYKTRQQGYALGARAIVYKDKFFAGMTVNGGIQKARSTTRFGIDHFDMYTGSAAFKVGYNIGFESDKYVVQPNMSTTYTYVKAEDYTAKSGLKIKSEGLNVVEFAPGLKLMYNHDNATQVYAKAAMIWDYIDGGDVKANDVALPEVSAKPYAEYGFGFEKSFTPSFVGFGEIVRHDGGREGWAGNFGLKYAF